MKKTGSAPWRAESNRVRLQNDSLEASFQAGFLYELKDRVTGRTLLSIDPSNLPAKLPLFGPPADFSLDACLVTQESTANSVVVRLRAGDQTDWTLRWKIEPGKGDLILQSSAQCAKAVAEFRFPIFGCDITRHTLVWISGYGVGHTANAPWNDVVLGDPESGGTPMKYPHPPVALFQGDGAGWFIEGRDPQVGPAFLMAKGTGQSANLGMDRRFIRPTTHPEMFEIRIRAYQKHWEDAVDPYVEWLEKGAGFLALDKLPLEQAWVSNLKSQAYVMVGNYHGIEDLAKRVTPGETFVGRQGEFRYYAFDIGYPDYRVPDNARKWAKRARELGFHVGMHFNIGSVSAMFPELIERFKPGFQVTGVDAKGNETYEHIYEGTNSMYRVSAALKDWRDYLVQQIRQAVQAGVDVIYLDEAMTPHGKILVGDTDGFEGTFLLMQEVLRTYPHVAIETEQFNLLTARYGKLALSQMPLGHPLSGYIFRKFVKVVPEGVMYSPTDNDLMDAFDAWGFMLPGADVGREGSWMRIAEAFHKYGLAPDSRLPREEFKVFAPHYSSGQLPVHASSIPNEGVRLFGFRGTNGVTAYLERHPNKRGLVLYKPGQPPEWIGTRLTGIRSHPGPGLPVSYTFREQFRDWLIYDGQTVLGLDPTKTYWFDETLRPSPTRFHLHQIPDDYVGVTDPERRAWTQEVGKEEAYFCIRLAGHGKVGACVPDEYDVYFSGRKLAVDRATHTVTFEVNASASKTASLGYHIELQPGQSATNQAASEHSGPVELVAYRRIDTPLIGPWIKLPWYGSPDTMKWITTNKAGDGFSMSVGTVGRLVGKMPKANSVRVRGSYQMAERGAGGVPGDGVIRVNGVEVLRVPHGTEPFPRTTFDVDVSRYAGQYVLIEFTSDGPVRAGYADWINPQIVAEP